MERSNAHLAIVAGRDVPALPANGYQSRKARQIAACLIEAAARSSVTLRELPAIAARMNMAEWQSVAFQAGVAVPDYSAKLLTIAYLRKAAA
jgi:hypothetical protein